MSNRSGRRPETEWQAAAFRTYGRVPVSRPTACVDGESIRSLERVPGENADGAIARAETLGWWGRRTRRAPWATARCWVWKVRV